MLPLLAAGIGGALSLFQGFQGRNDAKKASKHAALQAAMDREEFLRAQNENRARVDAANAYNEGAWLSATARNRASTEAVNARNAEIGNAYLALPKVDLKRMVADAEAAGFNPLTVIRNGGMAGYSKSVELPGYQMLMPTAFHETPYQQQHIFQTGAAPTSAGPAPVQGVGSVFAGALQDGFSQFMSQTRINEQQQFQRELLNASLAGVQRGKKAGNSASGSSFYVPGKVTAGSMAEWNPTTMLSPWKMPKAGEQPEVSNPHLHMSVKARYPDANSYNNRYDELSMGYGVRNWIADYAPDWAVNLVSARHRADTGALGILQRWNSGHGGAVRMQPIPPLAPLGFPSP